MPYPKSGKPHSARQASNSQEVAHARRRESINIISLFKLGNLWELRKPTMERCTRQDSLQLRHERLDSIQRND